MLVLPSFVCALALAAFGDAQLLGTAAQYGVFAATTITNTGNTVVNGNIGLSPGSSITGFPPGIYTGTQDINNGAATTAKNDIQSAYNSLAGMAADVDLTGQDLGGMTLQSGVYKFSSSGQLTGTLTLDAGGDPNALFVFQFGSTLTTASAAQVVLIGGAQACNVYWQVGSSATLGTGTSFLGNILASASITATTGVTNNGGLYALTAAVTLDTNNINAQGSCNGVVASSSTATSSMATAASTTPSSTLASTSPLTTASSTALSSTLMTTSTPDASSDMTVTSTTTITVTVPASTTTVTKTGGGTYTVTKTVSTKTSTCTSTKYSTSTRVMTTTCPTPKCTSTKASSTKVSSTSSNKGKRGQSKKTKTKTQTSYCAGHTSTKLQTSASVTHTVSATHTATSTNWHTSTSTKTSTSTHTPSCTTSAKARRDHQRMFV